jgi:hypothetical protein
MNKKTIALMIMLLTSGINVYAESPYDLGEIHSHHPPKEPLGLYIASFQISNLETGNIKEYQYRIYCPTKMVREITGSRWGDDAYFLDEDKQSFSGFAVMQKVIENVCKKSLQDSNKSRLP